MTKKSALLSGLPVLKSWTIKLTLQEGKLIDITFNDRQIAETHWNQLQAQGIIAGLAIRKYEWIDND
jgi:hypothetical protein